MIHLRITDPEKPAAGAMLGFPSDGRSPELGVAWVGWRQQLGSSLLQLLRGPSPPRKFLGAPYFRDCWIEPRFPKLAFITAIACQVMLIVFPPPIWKVRPVVPSPVPTAQQELTWYGPVHDLPTILPSRPAATSPRPKGTRPSEAERGADAFHPRQTIITTPLHPTHPRQTLVQPAAPPEPPRILPALPNIVQFAESQPARPKLQLTREQLAALRPKTPAHVKIPDAAIPQVDTPEKQLGTINIASSASAPPKPVLPVSPMSAPHAIRRQTDIPGDVPDVAAGATGAPNTLIALSATPGPVAPPPVIPPGNLSARISISPEGTRPGIPGGSVNGKKGAASGASGADTGAAGNSKGSGNARGPEGIFIGGGNRANRAPSSGLGMGSAARSEGNALPSSPALRSNLPQQESSASATASADSKIGVPPESVLSGKRVYTLHVNMPNLTSASGSWILSFAELDEKDGDISIGAAGRDLVGPVPLRKVDPKYPPELRTGRVEGDVVLYAVIRKDGTVDSIQLVRGVDPHLDANAMDALGQWKFRPGEKNGAPIDLEAVIQIPFRARTPLY